MSTHDEYIATFRHWLSARGRSQNTIIAYMSDVRQFLNHYSVSLVTSDILVRNLEELIANYLQSGNMSNATIARRLASLRLFAKAVFGLDILGDHPSPRPARGYAHPLPDGVDDLRRMIAAAAWRHRPLIALCGYAGARCEEARRVLATEVRQDDDGDWWVLLHGKGNADRHVPLAPEAIEHLHLDEAKGGLLVKLSDRGARYAITRAGERANVSRPVASHDLRMTFGTALHDMTKDLRLTQDLLGHRSSTTTERYTAVRRSAMVDAVRDVFA